MLRYTSVQFIKVGIVFNEAKTSTLYFRNANSFWNWLRWKSDRLHIFSINDQKVSILTGGEGEDARHVARGGLS